MPSKLALVWLFEQVSARLAADGTPVTNAFGWRIPAQHPYGNRIAWVPGDPSGSLGVIAPPRNPGTTPRSLFTLNELFTCVIYGEDLTDPENEIRQYEIVRYLRDAWLRAIYHTAHGAFTLRTEQWITDRLERRHGAALRCVCDIQATVPDVPFPETVPPAVIEVPTPPYEPLAADLTVQELDVTESIHVAGDDTP